MTFDLEKARAAIEEAVDRLNQKIDDEDGPIWEKEPEKAAVLQTLLAEITHLEKWVIKNRDIATDLQYQLDDEVKENNQLQTDLGKAREAVHTLENFAFASGKITAGQIQDILWGARLLAGASTEIEQLREANTNFACHATQAEDKIDSGDHIPDVTKKVWQITEERKAAIDRGLQFLEWSYAKNSAHDTKEQIAVLWAMLEEDTHGKP